MPGHHCIVSRRTGARRRISGIPFRALPERVPGCSAGDVHEDRPMAAIELDRVSKVYPDGTVAVSDLSLEIADGEFMVLVGPSGCGKTTALRMVAGLEDVSGGVIRIGDRDVNDASPSKDRDIAMVFQNYALYPHLTVAANMGFSLSLRKVEGRRSRGGSREAAEHARHRGLPRAQAAAALGWPAPARCHGSRDRARAAGVPDGRAAVEPRRQAAGADASRGRPHPTAPPASRPSTSPTTRPRP